jgi:hypothetical protein
VNEIGSYTLLLPADDNRKQLVLSIDVKFSSSGENAYISVVIRNLSTKLQNSAISVKNFSQRTLYIQQSAIKLDSKESIVYNVADYTIACGPGCWVPFGWTRITDNNTIKIGTGNDFHNAKYLNGRVDMNKADEVIIENELNISVKMWGSGYVVIVQDADQLFSGRHTPFASSEKSSDAEVNISISIAGLSVSIIPEEPIRRELYNVSSEGITFSYKQANLLELSEFNVNDVQIDNYASDSPTQSSVVLYTHRKQFIKGNHESNPAPFIQISSVRCITSPGMVLKYKYVAVLVKEFYLFADTSTITISIADLAEYLLTVNATSFVAGALVEEYNKQVTSHKSLCQMVDVHVALHDVKAAKLYIENLIVHPIKAHVTFFQVDFPRSGSEEKRLIRKYFWLKFLRFISIDDIVIKLNSFVVSNAMESIQTLNSR